MTARRGTVSVDIELATTTELGSDGWLVLAIDTNGRRGGDGGSDFGVIGTAQGTELTRWNGGEVVGFRHHPLDAAFNGRHFTFTLTLADLGAKRFGFSVKGVRGFDYDLAPAKGEFRFKPAKRR